MDISFEEQQRIIAENPEIDTILLYLLQRRWAAEATPYYPVIVCESPAWATALLKIALSLCFELKDWHSRRQMCYGYLSQKTVFITREDEARLLSHSLNVPYSETSAKQDVDQLVPVLRDILHPWLVRGHFLTQFIDTAKSKTSAEILDGFLDVINQVSADWPLLELRHYLLTRYSNEFEPITNESPRPISDEVRRDREIYEYIRHDTPRTRRHKSSGSEDMDPADMGMTQRCASL